MSFFIITTLQNTSKTDFSNINGYFNKNLCSLLMLKPPKFAQLVLEFKPDCDIISQNFRKIDHRRHREEIKTEKNEYI